MAIRWICDTCGHTDELHENGAACDRVDCACLMFRAQHGIDLETLDLVRLDEAAKRVVEKEVRRAGRWL